MGGKASKEPSTPAGVVNAALARSDGSVKRGSGFINPMLETEDQSLDTSKSIRRQVCLAPRCVREWRHG